VYNESSRIPVDVANQVSSVRSSGAPARYLTDLVVQSRHDSRLPWGTVTVNVVGSLVLGITSGALTGAAADHWVLLLVGTGFCGALTTFSTFSFETVRLLQQAQPRAAAVNVAVSVVGALVACAAGYQLAVAAS
jgi:CrcB protein